MIAIYRRRFFDNTALRSPGGLGGGWWSGLVPAVRVYRDCAAAPARLFRPMYGDVPKYLIILTEMRQPVAPVEPHLLPSRSPVGRIWGRGATWKAPMREDIGEVEFVEIAARRRAASYRGQAAHLVALAQEEPIGKLRVQLLGLASQYEEMADTLEISRG